MRGEKIAISWKQGLEQKHFRTKKLKFSKRNDFDKKNLEWKF